MTVRLQCSRKSVITLLPRFALLVDLTRLHLHPAAPAYPTMSRISPTFELYILCPVALFSFVAVLSLPWQHHGSDVNSTRLACMTVITFAVNCVLAILIGLDQVPRIHERNWLSRFVQDGS